jgi:YD repeat-containing protein
MRTVIIVLCIWLMVVSCNKDGTNANGRLLSRITQNGLVSEEFSYDDQGRLSKKVFYTTPGSGLIGDEELRYYDNAGRLVRTETASNISSSTTAVQLVRFYAEMVYDANGLLKETKNYTLWNGSYQFATRIVTEHDASGRIISATSFDPSNIAFGRDVYTWDSRNNIITEQHYDPRTGTQPVYVINYEYDDYRNAYKNVLTLLPWGASENNIIRIVRSNFPATSSTTTDIIIKSYTRDRVPRIVSEGGVDREYEYR